MAIFPQGPGQLAIAEQSREKVRRKEGEAYVDVLPDTKFWPAETLHQKFDLQRTRPKLTAELAARYPGLEAFLASPAAARLNSCLGSFASEKALAEAAAAVGMKVEELRLRLDKNETGAQSGGGS